jgi:hypothetical protein
MEGMLYNLDVGIQKLSHTLENHEWSTSIWPSLKIAFYLQVVLCQAL